MEQIKSFLNTEVAGVKVQYIVLGVIGGYFAFPFIKKALNL